MGHLKPKTRLDYEINLRRHVLPLLGDAPVGSTDRPTMRRFTSDLTAGGAGPAVVRIAAQVARRVLSVAVDAGALEANSASALRLVRRHESEMLFLRPEEVHALAGAIAPPYGTLIRFAAETGLRAGEIGALRVRRIDFRRGRVEVAEAVSDVAGQPIAGPTETYANRHVPMPPRLLEELSNYLGPRREGREELVFTSPPGGPLRHGNFYKSKFKPAVRAAGLPEGLPFHGLRHTYAAFCIASTIDRYAAMRRMGHSSITVTYDTYGHLFPEQDTEIADDLDGLFQRGVDFLWTRPELPRNPGASA